MKLKYLTSNEVLKIHHASLRVLGEIGILLDDPETRTLLADSGARLLDERAYLPPDLIMSCLQGCPREVSLRGRSSEVTLGSGRLHVHNLGGARDVLEEPWSDLRPATFADVAQSEIGRAHV